MQEMAIDEAERGEYYAAYIRLVPTGLSEPIYKSYGFKEKRYPGDDDDYFYSGDLTEERLHVEDNQAKYHDHPLKR